MNRSQVVRDMLARKELVVAPGGYSGLTAKIVEQAGFKAVYMSGYLTAASTLGLPDLGLLTMSEMARNVRAMADAVEIPVIADADTGYGNVVNVVRTVREYEKAGAAAIHIEDQVWPKRCGHMEGKGVIPKEEMITKVRAATDCRLSGDFVIIARTDALAVEGLEAAIDRCHAYAEAGADVVFVDGQRTREDLEAVPRRCSEVPCMMTVGPLTPALSIREIEKLGYSIAIFPVICVSASVPAMLEALRRFRETGEPSPTQEELMPLFRSMNNLLGAPFYMNLEERLAGGKVAR
ncbi:MAG: isocitrate lyase/PEP mutase family protein [bacterium]